MLAAARCLQAFESHLKRMLKSLEEPTA